MSYSKNVVFQRYDIIKEICDIAVYVHETYVKSSTVCGLTHIRLPLNSMKILFSGGQGNEDYTFHMELISTDSNESVNLSFDNIDLRDDNTLPMFMEIDTTSNSFSLDCRGTAQIIRVPVLKGNDDYDVIDIPYTMDDINTLESVLFQYSTLYSNVPESTDFLRAYTCMKDMVLQNNMQFGNITNTTNDNKYFNVEKLKSAYEELRAIR